MGLRSFLVVKVIAKYFDEKMLKKIGFGRQQILKPNTCTARKNVPSVLFGNILVRPNWIMECSDINLLNPCFILLCHTPIYEITTLWKWNTTSEKARILLFCNVKDVYVCVYFYPWLKKMIIDTQIFGQNLQKTRQTRNDKFESFI